MRSIRESVPGKLRQQNSRDPAPLKLSISLDWVAEQKKAVVAAPAKPATGTTQAVLGPNLRVHLDLAIATLAAQTKEERTEGAGYRAAVD